MSGKNPEYGHSQSEMLMTTHFSQYAAQPHQHFVMNQHHGRNQHTEGDSGDKQATGFF